MQAVPSLKLLDLRKVRYLCSVFRVYTLSGVNSGSCEIGEIVGVDGGEGTPVPIPNTAVKLTCADNTWLVAAREDR